MSLLFLYICQKTGFVYEKLKLEKKLYMKSLS